MSIKISSPDSFRENIRLKLSAVLNNPQTVEQCSNKKDLDYIKLATNLEKAIYNYAIKEAHNHKIVKKWENMAFVQLYTDRLRSIYINLKNIELVRLIQTEEVTPQALAFMTHQELNPGHWKELIDQKIKRDASKFSVNIEASTDMFTCKKCKSKRCTYYELQTRSADEPATIFVTCIDCGKHWKS